MVFRGRPIARLSLLCVGFNKYIVARWEDFIGLSFQDLELLGQVGNRINGIYSPRDPNSMETVRSIIKS